MYFDLDNRELLRNRANRLQERPVGCAGTRHKQVALGRAQAGRTVTMLISETTLAIALDDPHDPSDPDGGDTRIVRRTNSNACVASRDSDRGSLTPQFPRRNVKQVLTQIRQGPTASRQGSQGLCAPSTDARQSSVK